MKARFAVLESRHPQAKDDFREFVYTLTVALRQIEKANSPIKHIHPVVVKETQLFDAGAEG